MKYGFFLAVWAVVLGHVAACAAEPAAVAPPKLAEPSRVAMAVDVVPEAPRDCEPLGSIQVTSHGKPSRGRCADAEVRLRERAVNRGANTVSISKREYGANFVSIHGVAFICPTVGTRR